ncbi:GIY-YIG nuclease family protein [Xanthomonas campestris]|uniref:GIY-YIG nuclease family protein n=2 Tax=Xanthomonas campestris TaxID=339 RepID=UPI0021875010|nr:GIY-YIG nuclease family protein [Xanthomonas campestris]MCC4624240.1 GIY-YIG nuclease family protein [Xanthomonas campestris pv. nigromaculans]MDM7709844.1 GIY-YIG nuclease family protein [Xanthomonas campestris pv. campestris]MDM7872613.1 GIY-YIG nuclease family protein [Xanthomonas campestris pv. campestris]CAH2707347.1 GIY-YIG nuclease family protein [Xanthomonas campestris pv. nigromaculans]
MNKEFFPARSAATPTIYAYEDSHPEYKGMLKVGYTARSAASRVAQQYPTAKPGKQPYTIVLEESAMRSDGSAFTDHDVHRALMQAGVKRKGGEWFACTAKQVRAAIVALRERGEIEQTRDLDFVMRPEQTVAVKKTADYFNTFGEDKINKGKAPHFLWNAKMRFGKTFASYQLAKKMGWKRILVLTFKPAVQNAWEEDLVRHVDFRNWQFVKPGGLSPERVDWKRPVVCFGSFQDYLGKNKSTGGVKTKNEWVHTTNWDCVILDEYHYGAWRESAKELFEAEDKREAKFGEGEGIEDFDEDVMPITTGHYLYLSGTPFRAIASGEFIEDQIFNWTYSDEQRAKDNWSSADYNPYAMLPRMVLLTYQLPDSIREIAMQGEYSEFDLNVFFSAKGEGGRANFIYEDDVQKWLDLIRGSFSETTVDNLKIGAQKPPMPFSDSRLLSLLTHTFWFLPSVASCHAMNNLLGRRQNRFYHDYEVVVAAGSDAGIGAAALPPVQDAMGDPLKTKTITLSCGKLTTGVTVKPWTGILMLRNSSSPETYFQAAFRVQSPWTIRNPDGNSPNKEEIVKEECYVFDFAPDRALRQIADYSCRLNVNESNPEQKVAEFISFLPVLAYDGSSMKQVDAAGILDIAMSGTTATLLARRWESALLVNVDNDTLRRVISNEKAMKALMSIEGFRNLNQEIETIINKSEAIKKAKKEKNDEEMSKREREELSKEEREYKSLRKKIQEKLIKFATRIPVFMYLTDYRERTLKDVITQLEPGLFKRVTGLTVPDFELLVSLSVFNSALMNDAVYKFKRYEDASLAYAGVNKHEGEDVGLFDTVLTHADAAKVYSNIPA